MATKKAQQRTTALAVTSENGIELRPLDGGLIEWHLTDQFSLLTPQEWTDAVLRLMDRIRRNEAPADRCLSDALRLAIHAGAIEWLVDGPAKAAGVMDRHEHLAHRLFMSLVEVTGKLRGEAWLLAARQWEREHQAELRQVRVDHLVRPPPPLPQPSGTQRRKSASTKRMEQAIEKLRKLMRARPKLKTAKVATVIAALSKAGIEGKRDAVTRWRKDALAGD